MSKGQKFLKFLAICLAFFIIFAVLSGIFSCVSFFSYVFNSNSIYEVSNGKTITSPVYKLDVYVGEADLQIKEGESLYVETDCDNVEIVANKGVLTVSEVRRPLSVSLEGKQVVIYIPKDTRFESVNIETGAGKIDISDIKTDELTLELGAGKIDMKNIEVALSADIDGGAGAINASNCYFYDLNLDLGTGHSVIEASLVGEADIDCGVGNTDLTLLKDKFDYSVNVDKGIGEVTVDGVQAKDDDTFGDGSNEIDISCGVGNVTIVTSTKNFER